jgi:hypothetical protein
MDSISLMKRREGLVYLITPQGLLPFHFIWPDVPGKSLVSLTKLGATKIAYNDSLTIQYDSEKQRDNAYDDVFDQCKRIHQAIIAAKVDGEQLKAKHKAEMDALYAKHFGEIKDMNRAAHE